MYNHSIKCYLTNNEEKMMQYLVEFVLKTT